MPKQRTDKGQTKDKVGRPREIGGNHQGDKDGRFEVEKKQARLEFAWEFVPAKEKYNPVRRLPFWDGRSVLRAVCGVWVWMWCVGVYLITRFGLCMGGAEQRLGPLGVEH